MTETVLFAGGELEAFNRFDTDSVESTQGGSYDSAVARESIRAGYTSTADYIETPVFASQTTIWVRWTHYNATSSTTNFVPLTLYNSSGTAVFRIRLSASETLQCEYWNGSAWVAIGSTFTITLGSRQSYALKLICGGSGSMEVYKNSISVSSGSASMTSVDNIAKARWGTVSSTADTARQAHVSECVVSTDQLADARLTLKPPTGAGADADGTGTYADIDEATFSDVDFIALAAAGDNNSFTSAARSFGAFDVRCVGITARLKCGVTGPQKAKFYIVRGGTRYYGSDITLTTSFAPYGEYWELDPSTGVAWVRADAESASLEWGVEAVT